MYADGDAYIPLIRSSGSATETGKRVQHCKNGEQLLSVTGENILRT